MSILIKGMEMPARCVDCRFCDEIDGTCIALNDNSTACYTGKPKWCPLIEVPSPHGRLIDADAIPYIFGSTHATEYDTVTKFVINKLPTIIGAEGT